MRKDGLVKLDKSVVEKLLELQNIFDEFREQLDEVKEETENDNISHAIQKITAKSYEINGILHLILTPYQ